MTNDQLEQQQDTWNHFCESRETYITNLAETVEQGFIRRDTGHPTFCGCIDWHSSVHGAYALLLAARLTGQHRWNELIDRAFTPECLGAELESLQRKDLDHEMPYGFAWFLKLAREREQGWGKTDVLPLARDIALKLEEWIFGFPAGAVITHVQRRDYGNLSWALLNLWEWSQWTENERLMEKLRTFTRMRVLLLDGALPSSYDHVTDEFFAASLQRTTTILTILPKAEALQWYESFYTKELSLTPLQIAATPHSAGLNFSRAWGFWSLFCFTGRESYRQLYLDHILTHLNMPDCWRNDYQKHAHWVPQFGIYAIALSMEEGE